MAYSSHARVCLMFILVCSMFLAWATVYDLLAKLTDVGGVP